MSEPKAHLIITLVFNTLDDLLPAKTIRSGRDPYDYAIMTPDYKWHYYAQYETEWGTRWKGVTLTGEDLT